MRMLIAINAAMPFFPIEVPEEPIGPSPENQKPNRWAIYAEL